MMELPEPTESDRLRRSWQRVEAETLDAYLVSGVEDPRINVQSILNRALLCDAIFPGRFTRLIEEELHFGFTTTRNLIDGNEPPAKSLDAFQNIWRRELDGLSHEGYSLFEPACGSANDYRYLASYGIARFFRYAGLDIAPKNVANARRRFPNVDFRVGDLMQSGLADLSFDFSFVHDLFEHLSLDGVHRAVEELLRLTSSSKSMAKHLPR